VLGAYHVDGLSCRGTRCPWHRFRRLLGELPPPATKQPTHRRVSEKAPCRRSSAGAHGATGRPGRRRGRAHRPCRPAQHEWAVPAVLPGVCTHCARAELSTELSNPARTRAGCARTASAHLRAARGCCAGSRRTAWHPRRRRCSSFSASVSRHSPYLVTNGTRTFFRLVLRSAPTTTTGSPEAANWLRSEPAPSSIQPTRSHRRRRRSDRMRAPAARSIFSRNREKSGELLTPTGKAYYKTRRNKKA
jgi:hypothetical protein